MPWAGREPLAGPVARLGCYRGIAELGALTLAAEVVDWRRFPAARAFISYTGLVPSEYSSGERTRRGHITTTSSQPVRTTLTEAAWAYRHAPAVGAGLARRPPQRRPGHPGPVLDGAAAAARPVRAPAARRERQAPEAATAVARELAGDLWAEVDRLSPSPGDLHRAGGVPASCPRPLGMRM